MNVQSEFDTQSFHLFGRAHLFFLFGILVVCRLMRIDSTSATTSASATASFAALSFCGLRSSLRVVCLQLLFLSPPLWAAGSSPVDGSAQLWSDQQTPCNKGC